MKYGFKSHLAYHNARVAQPAEATDLGSVKWSFESTHAYFGTVAELADAPVRDAGVSCRRAGANPAGATTGELTDEVSGLLGKQCDVERHWASIAQLSAKWKHGRVD